VSTSGDLRFRPQSEHANVSADIDHRIVDLQFETHVRVLTALKGFPTQVSGDGRIAVEVK
jgi:hypothetical protein